MLQIVRHQSLRSGSHWKVAYFFLPFCHGLLFLPFPLSLPSFLLFCRSQMLKFLLEREFLVSFPSLFFPLRLSCFQFLKQCPQMQCRQASDLSQLGSRSHTVPLSSSFQFCIFSKMLVWKFKSSIQLYFWLEVIYYNS